MKRHREDGSTGPLLKRPSTAPGEQSEPGRLTTEDALSYLRAVKEKFKDDNDKYNEFLEIMKAFKAQRTDTAGVIASVKELFKGHNKLIIGFNAFLPKGFEITLPEDDPPPKKAPVEFDQAINFVNKIKTRFQHDEQVYKAFLEILNKYRKGNKSISDVYQEVATLFCDHPDLLDEFTCFLPDTSGPVHAAGPAPPSKAIGRKDDKFNNQARPVPSDKMKKEKNISTADRLDIDRPVVKMEKEQRRKVEKEREKKADRDLKEREQDEKAIDPELDLDGLRLPHKRKSARRADELIRKQSQATDGGETFVGPPLAIPEFDDREDSKGANVPKEFAFFKEVKERVRSRDTYQQLLKCLNLYNEQIISSTVLQSLVSGLLRNYPDILEGLNEILARCENNETEQGEPAPFKIKVEKEKEREKDRDKEKDRDAEKHKEREKEREKEKEKERDREREREKEKGERERPVHSKDTAAQKMLANKDKFINKPISELDLSNSERCTPSYRMLPKNYPKMISSHRTELGQSVLNDNWVSVTSGSEDYSFKHMRKNQYEESLFRCEDDRFELDMLLESTAVTAKHVEKLMDKLQDPTKQEMQIRIDDHLSAINLRCIERIYGDHGLDIIELMRKNPAAALPVIHNRLKQKQDEWSKCRDDMNKVWAGVYAKNYHKSLDHRSFYFKQQDKKSLSTKGLLAEIKELNEKRKEDDAMLFTSNRRLLMQDLKFTYSDPSIHEDLFQIMKYSADEVCNTMEQSDKVMRIWTSFLEPLFGVPSRAHDAEDTEEAAKVKSRESKERGSSAGESAASGDIECPEGAHAAEDKTRAVVDDFATASSKVEACNGGTSDVQMSSAKQGSMEPEAMPSGNFEPAKLQHATASNSERTTFKKPPNPVEKIEVYRVAPPKTEATEKSELFRGLRFSNAQGRSDNPTEKAETCREPTLSNPSDRLEATKSLEYLQQQSNEISVEAEVAKARGVTRMDIEEEGDSRVCAVAKEEVEKNLGVASMHESHTRIDREEGELSPSPETDDKTTHNFAGQNHKNSRPNKDFIRHDDEEDVEGDAEAHGEHDADADDEGEETPQEDSENAYDAAEGGSGSESGDADEGSHDDHEEEDEDEEHEKAESECEAEGMADADDGEGDGISSLTSLDRSFSMCKPLAAHMSTLDPLASPAKENTILYGNDMIYILFRLHQTLYERICSAKTNAQAAERKWKSIKDTAPPNLYDKFVRVLYNLLDGSADNAKFEDECRSIIGTQSYVLFTLDKLIFKLVKQLQAVAADDTANRLLALHSYEKSRAVHGFIDFIYHANACVLLHDENIYRFEHKVNSNEVLIQLMDGAPEKLEVPPSAMEFSFANYLSEFLLMLSDVKDSRNVFLERNRRRVVNVDEADALLEAMKNVRVFNGLEYKISCKTSKVSYVLDTEDFFYRPKKFRPRIAKRSICNTSNRKSISDCLLKFQKCTETQSEDMADR